MIKLTFDDLTSDQAFALLSTYKSVKGQLTERPLELTARQADAPQAAIRPAETAPAPAAATAPAAAVVPVQAPPAFTFDDLARAAAPLMDAGKTADLSALLHSFGVQALTQLPKEQYGTFATALRGMGARI